MYDFTKSKNLTGYPKIITMTAIAGS